MQHFLFFFFWPHLSQQGYSYICSSMHFFLYRYKGHYGIAPCSVNFISAVIHFICWFYTQNEKVSRSSRNPQISHGTYTSHPEETPPGPSARCQPGGLSPAPLQPELWISPLFKVETTHTATSSRHKQFSTGKPVSLKCSIYQPGVLLG